MKTTSRAWGKFSPESCCAGGCLVHPCPVVGPLFLLKTKTKYRRGQFIYDCFVKWSNPLTVFNLPVFEQIINVVAIKTKEVNQIQLAGNETEPSNNYHELCSSDPATAASRDLHFKSDLALALPRHPRISTAKETAHWALTTQGHKCSTLCDYGIQKLGCNDSGYHLIECNKMLRFLPGKKKKKI